MNEDLIKILGIVIALFIIVYFILKMFHIKEGLENNTSSNNIGDITANMAGVAGSAANYAAALKSKTVQLQDSILISKYRTDYENVIINMEEYFSMLMLEQTLSMNASDSVKTNMERIAAINTLSQGKKSLNEVMAFIDKQ
jgi:hypothetical protein